ncbi:MAG: LamG-like jellyroll fold domain-containing protein [Planctomycetota bacterium]|jgi:hypothetical protein
MAINLASNCLLQYKMNDDNAQSQVDDTSGNNNHGALRLGGPPLATQTQSVDPGKLDKALEFDGLGSNPGVAGVYIDLTTPIELSGFWALTVWIYLDANDNSPRIIVDKSHPSQSYIQVQDNSGQVTIIFCNNSGSLVTWTTISNGVPALHHQWRQLTFISIAAGVSLQLFVDNIYKGSKSINTNLRIESVSYGLNGNYRFKGYIDCLDIFDKNLSIEERNFLYNGGVGTERLRSPVRSLVDSSLVGNSLVGKGLS